MLILFTFVFTSGGVVKTLILFGDKIKYDTLGYVGIYNDEKYIWYYWYSVRGVDYTYIITIWLTAIYILTPIHSSQDRHLGHVKINIVTLCQKKISQQILNGNKFVNKKVSVRHQLQITTRGTDSTCSRLQSASSKGNRCLWNSCS